MKRYTCQYCGQSSDDPLFLTGYDVCMSCRFQPTVEEAMQEAWMWMERWARELSEDGEPEQ